MSPRSIYCELDSEDKLNEMYEKMEDPETKAKEFFSKYGEVFEVVSLTLLDDSRIKSDESRDRTP